MWIPAIGRPLTKSAAGRASVASVVVLTLVFGITACSVEKTDANADIPAPEYQAVGEAIRVPVSPSEPLAVSVPGLGRIVGPSGAFASDGELIVTRLEATTDGESFVNAAGPGVDVRFENTSLVSPLTVFFDDPAIGESLPGDALPLVLHLPDGSPWEVRALEFTPDGVPFIITKDFSPNLMSWIPIPEEWRQTQIQVENWFGGAVTPRTCEGGGPDWGWVSESSGLVNLCTISNTDPDSGVIRTELQVQSNRQYFQWVSVPYGNDYLWASNQDEATMRALAAITGRDTSREVLVRGEDWFSVGYRQGTDAATKEFRAYTDEWTTAFDIVASVVGFVPNNKGGWAGMVVLAAQCSQSMGSPTDLIGCAVEEALSNLENRDTAIAAAMDIFGERSYAEAYADKLQSLSEGLRWLGRAFKLLGVLEVLRTLIPRILDSTQTDARFEYFSLSLSPPARVTQPDAGTSVTPPQGTQPSAPEINVSPPAPPPAQSNPRAWVTRSGDLISYHWENMPPGMWPEVDRFRCWRFTRQTHPGGWATDGCGQQTGFAGFPSGSGVVTFRFGGASDSFSIEPWKYGPWLNVGESWSG